VVVGITGSSGKTSTKDALHAMLAGRRRVIAAAAGHNNEIGLPLTLCAIAADTEVAVCELAMRGPGQIAALAALARPRVGVITNVGTAHLGVLGSREAIAAAKAELLAALPDGGVAIVPHGEAMLAAALREGLLRLTFGESPAADAAVLHREPLPEGQRVRYRVAGEEREVVVPLPGRHQALNVAAALAAAHALGLPLDDALAGIPAIRLQPWRGEVVELGGGAVAINDAYNANPASVGAALEALQERDVAGRRIAVLGEMAELGAEGPALHREIGEEAAARGVDVLIAVGEAAGPYLDGAGPAVEAHAVADGAAALDLLAALVRSGDAVLVKASRAVRLEDLAAGLAARLANEERP
jgi:UDP-N-acetylmuramoyl-tripeptide--D-alanyl-D-alanine ligase